MKKKIKKTDIVEDQINVVNEECQINKETKIKGRVVGAGGWTVEHINIFLDFAFNLENALNLKRNIVTEDRNTFGNNNVV